MILNFFLLRLVGILSLYLFARSASVPSASSFATSLHVSHASIINGSAYVLPSDPLVVFVEYPKTIEICSANSTVTNITTPIIQWHIASDCELSPITTTTTRSSILYLPNLSPYCEYTVTASTSIAGLTSDTSLSIFTPVPHITFNATASTHGITFTSSSDLPLLYYVTSKSSSAVLADDSADITTISPALNASAIEVYYASYPVYTYAVGTNNTGGMCNISDICAHANVVACLYAVHSSTALSTATVLPLLTTLSAKITTAYEIDLYLMVLRRLSGSSVTNNIILNLTSTVLAKLTTPISPSTLQSLCTSLVDILSATTTGASVSQVSGVVQPLVNTIMHSFYPLNVNSTKGNTMLSVVNSIGSSINSTSVNIGRYGIATSPSLITAVSSLTDDFNKFITHEVSNSVGTVSSNISNCSTLMTTQDLIVTSGLLAMPLPLCSNIATCYNATTILYPLHSPVMVFNGYQSTTILNISLDVVVDIPLSIPATLWTNLSSISKPKMSRWLHCYGSESWYSPDVTTFNTQAEFLAVVLLAKNSNAKNALQKYNNNKEKAAASISAVRTNMSLPCYYNATSATTLLQWGPFVFNSDPIITLRDPCGGCNDRGVCVLLHTLPICICDGAYSGRYCQHSPIGSNSNSKQFNFKSLRTTSGLGGLLMLVLILLLLAIAGYKIRGYVESLGTAQDVAVNYNLQSVSWADITLLQLVSPLFAAVDTWWSSNNSVSRYSSIEMREPDADEVLFAASMTRNRGTRRRREE